MTKFSRSRIGSTDTPEGPPVYRVEGCLREKMTFAARSREIAQGAPNNLP